MAFNNSARLNEPLSRRKALVASAAGLSFLAANSLLPPQARSQQLCLEDVPDTGLSYYLAIFDSRSTTRSERGLMVYAARDCAENHHSASS